MTLPFEYVEDDATRRNFEQIAAALGAISKLPVFWLDSGTPQNQIVASPPAVCFVYGGGSSTTMFLKTSGTATNTGWLPVMNT